jgi:NNP family nitrate/nitrite transporter-like MFS transporter
VYPKEGRGEFKQVAMLEFTYIVNFGSKLAVVSMLPEFFETTFAIPKALAGFLGSAFVFVNLVARPGGGLLPTSAVPARRRWAVLSSCRQEKGPASQWCRW